VTRAAVVLFALAVVGVALVAAGNLGVGPLVITREGEQKMILLLGDVRTVTSPGATLRLPFLETVQTFERRWLYLNTDALPIQTKDGEQLVVDNYAIWRIDDAERFRQAFPAGRKEAEKRIDRVVASVVREVVGRHSLPEVLSVLSSNQIMVFAVAEIPVILGLALYFVGGYLVDFYVLAAVSVLAFALAFPSTREWAAALSRIRASLPELFSARCP
jgi:hypothetical protein